MKWSRYHHHHHINTLTKPFQQVPALGTLGTLVRPAYSIARFFQQRSYMLDMNDVGLVSPVNYYRHRSSMAFQLACCLKPSETRYNPPCTFPTTWNLPSKTVSHDGSIHSLVHSFGITVEC